jgi:hypothetical protein
MKMEAGSSFEFGLLGEGSDRQRFQTDSVANDERRSVEPD